MKRFLSTIVTVAALTLAACDSGPSGPGELDATLQGPNQTLGGAVVEISGKGIEGFAGSGGTRVFSSAVTGSPDTYRVILLNETPGELRFRVSVQDVGGNDPTSTVVSLVNGINASLPATGDYRVRFSR
jgi:hypothetical protein